MCCFGTKCNGTTIVSCSHVKCCVYNQLFLIQVPALCEDLLSSVDQPLKIARDKQTGKDYLLCDYNRDGDSYRYNAQFGDVTSLCTPVECTSQGTHQYWHLLVYCPSSIFNCI